MIPRRDEDANANANANEDAMLMMMMMMMETDGSSSSVFSNASRARHPSSTTVPTHHRAHAREFGLEELFARVSLPATLAARSMGVSETTFKLRCDARGVGKRRKRRKRKSARGVTTGHDRSRPVIGTVDLDDDGLTDRDSSRGGGWTRWRFRIFFAVFFFISIFRARAGLDRWRVCRSVAMRGGATATDALDRGARASRVK